MRIRFTGNPIKEGAMTDTPSDELLEEAFFRSFNMTAPLQARKWLALLEEHPHFGFRLKPNLELPGNYMGFSYASNGLGLRGPCRTDGQGVILGTSFAMGFAVNNGDNWYDDSRFSDNFLNLGLPVGAAQMRCMLDHLYSGSSEIGVFIYHANVWEISTGFYKWSTQDIGAFQAFNWNTDLEKCLDKTLEKIKSFRQKFGTEHTIKRLDGADYLLNYNYARFSPEKNAVRYDEIASEFRAMLERFERVVVLRIPTKEEVAAASCEDERLAPLVESHQAGWSFFKQSITGLPKPVTLIDSSGFTLADFHPFDTHWNSRGNRTFKNIALAAIQTDRTGYGIETSCGPFAQQGFEKAISTGLRSGE
jgi:hypothetical protein